MDNPTLFIGHHWTPIGSARCKKTYLSIHLSWKIPDDLNLKWPCFGFDCRWLSRPCSPVGCWPWLGFPGWAFSSLTTSCPQIRVRRSATWSHVNQAMSSQPKPMPESFRNIDANPKGPGPSWGCLWPPKTNFWKYELTSKTLRRYLDPENRSPIDIECSSSHVRVRSMEEGGTSAHPPRRLWMGLRST